MYYHAIRVSSVAMCSTWVWDASVLFSGLPLLFPFVSFYVPERFLMLDLLYIYVPERFPLFRGFQPHVDVFAKLTKCVGLLKKSEMLKPNPSNLLGDFNGNYLHESVLCYIPMWHFLKMS